MGLHRPSGRWRLGLSLAMVTVLCWGGLPIAIAVVLQQVDPYTLLWFRFLVAAFILAAILRSRQSLPKVRGKPWRVWVMFIAAAGGLFVNYLTYKLSLQSISPGTAQVVIQLAPLLFILGSVWIFGESFSLSQRFGVALLISGLFLFFDGKIPNPFVPDGGDENLGLMWITVSALSWAVYALAQKQLLSHFGSQQLMFMIFAVSALACIPLAEPSALLDLDQLGWALAVFCALNTLVAYGAFSEALSHWDGSRVSAVLSLTPLMSLLLIGMSSRLWPEVVKPEGLSVVSYAGAVLVVAGSMTTALGRTQVR